MQNPRVSVVMPIYNRAYCVQDAVRSIHDQTLDDWELIVVDDGSDDSDELVRKLSSFDDERIHYYREPHTGNISKVRNIGCSVARGKYIVVHDSDDMAFPNRLEEIVKGFESDESVDVVYHGMYIRALDVDRNAVARVWKPSQKYDKQRLLREQYIPGQFALKRSVWEEIKYDEAFPLIDDWVFLIDLAMADKKFLQLDKDIYEYVTLNDSININGEMQGNRKTDVVRLIQKLKDKYGITDIHADMTRHTEFGITKETVA